MVEGFQARIKTLAVLRNNTLLGFLKISAAEDSGSTGNDAQKPHRTFAHRLSVQSVFVMPAAGINHKHE
jgi:hypothetical protein